MSVKASSPDSFFLLPERSKLLITFERSAGGKIPEFAILRSSDLQKEYFYCMKPNIAGLETEITFKTSRSGGSGGQHVNKVSSKVELNFDPGASHFLTEEQRSAILEKLAPRISTEGILQIVVQTERSQLRNKKIALDKFRELIESCFIVRKKRKPTKIPKAVIEKRLLAKKRKAEIKKNRKLPPL